MGERKATIEEPLGRHLIRLFRNFENELVDGLRRKGYTTLTPGHLDLLRHLDNDGLRAVDLARDAGVSRQAANKMVQTVEREGWVSREVDPDDARSFLIRYTPRGAKLMKQAVALVLEAETRYATELGAKRYRQLKRDLAQLEGLYADE